MDCLASISTHASSASCAYSLLLHSLSVIPIWHYLIGFFIGYLFFIYNFLEFHFIEDLLTGFRGSPVKITYGHCSEIYDGVVSKCKILHGRYLATPWLSSPHIQTTFLNFFGRPPSFSYRRQMFHAADGGTMALDWLASSDVSRGAFQMHNLISKEDTTPIAVVIPGLTSDSSSPYLKHLAFGIAKHGWNVVVGNHRGLGGVSVTSDCFYNAGWTEDTRAVIRYLHNEYSKAPLFAIGTSIGANILVKYLGEDGENVPIAGAVAICSPWDLLIGDRFISRRLVQKLYDRALTIGLQGYAKLHEPRYSRLANWEGIRKSRSIRDFDNYATCLVGKFETVDTYYRRCSSSCYVGNVSVPLLCISALDDPVCTREAIPWDECRANKNIVLATVKHGGHLAFFEGITASGLWWVRAVNEFLHVLHASPFMHVQKEIKNSGQHSSMESEIDQGPFINMNDGLVAAAGTDHPKDIFPEETNQTVTDSGINNGNITETKSEFFVTLQKASPKTAAVTDSIARHLSQISKKTRMSVWLLAYVAVVTSWPTVGSMLRAIFNGRLRKLKR